LLFIIDYLAILMFFCIPPEEQNNFAELLYSVRADIVPHRKFTV